MKKVEIEIRPAQHARPVVGRGPPELVQAYWPLYQLALNVVDMGVSLDANFRPEFCGGSFVDFEGLGLSK
jgi:hypothetical protein